MLVREGVLLRRRWDRLGPDAPHRRQLLTSLPAVQTVAQHRLVECVERPQPFGGAISPAADQGAKAELVRLVIEQLAEDDQYLVDLLNDQTLSAESAAFAVECFRDDLHWLGTQVAVLDGGRSVDFPGRILLEEQALQRQMDAWEDEIPTTTSRAIRSGIGPADSTAPRPHDAPEAADVHAQGDPQAAVSLAAGQLREAARRLRETALARQIEALLDQPEPEDWPSWYRTWQAASRLEMRLGAESPLRWWDMASAHTPQRDEPAGAGGPLGSDAHRSVEEVRTRAANRWSESLEQLSPHARSDALNRVADELADATCESLTFLEDLSLPSAVRTLEVLQQDSAVCLRAIEEHPTQQLRGLGGMLRRRRAAVAAELQERRLAWRMEHLFGRAFAAALERLILFLLLFFVIMIAAEGPLLAYEADRGGFALHSGQSRIEPIFAWMDLGICLVFLAEFSLKMALAQRRWLYLKRNWLIGLLPAIPISFFAYATHRLTLAAETEWVVLLRALRYLRLPRLARWLRIARPVLRMARLVGFLIRASDRLVRQLTPLLNRNLVLFEQAAISVQEPTYRTSLAALRERFYYRAGEVLSELGPLSRCRLAKARIEDLTAMLSGAGIGQVMPAVSVSVVGTRRWGVCADAIPHHRAVPSTHVIEKGSAVREMPLERIIARLLAATPAGISDRIGRTLADSVARWCHSFDVFAVRRLPLVRDLVAAGRLRSPYDTTAQVANRIGLMLKQLLDRVYWVADLYGTVTAPQLVDSMGEYMVRGSARPARRLVLIGAAFLAVTYLASLLPLPTLNQLSETLRELVAWPLVVLGGICLLAFGLGIWLRRIAGEATEFYTQVAQAQFIAATKKLKHRLAQRHHAILHRRVIGPELEMAAGATSSGEQSAGAAARPFGGAFACPTDGGDQAETACAAVDLLWQDYLDGAPFHSDDTKTTTQLLGNLALVSLRETRLRYSRRQRRQLRRIDLTSNRMSMRGPYLWFHFISRSLAQQTAKLVVDFNAFALPLSRAAGAEDETIRQYVQWLGRRLAKPVDQLDLPLPFRRRLDALLKKNDDDSLAKPRNRGFHGNDFTAIHFLSADRQIEADIRRRYGDQVANLMRICRRDNVRRVFRTYPFHHWPKERRTFNPLSLYQRHLAGGRILLFPVKMLWWAAVLLLRGIRFVWMVVRDVLHPSAADVTALEESDPFEVAVRKIHRMRKPLFLECLRMRAEFDPEYLGILLPGVSTHVRGTAAVQIEDDLATIRAEPNVKRRFRRLAAERRRQILEFRRWLDLLGAHGHSSQSLRAMAIAYTIDYQGVRSRLEATRLLERAFDQAVTQNSGPSDSTAGRGWSVAALWYRWRLGDVLDRLFQQSAFVRFDQAEQSVCRRLVCRRRGLLLKAVRQLTEYSSAGDDPVQHARKVLLGVGRDPDTWSRQLVILRAVQTLSVLDLKTYCDLVAELGEYDTCSSSEIADSELAAP